MDDREREEAPQPNRAGTEPAGPAEAAGPLELWRYRKPDGRALLLFRRRERDDE